LFPHGRKKVSLDFEEGRRRVTPYALLLKFERVIGEKTGAPVCLRNSPTEKAINLNHAKRLLIACGYNWDMAVAIIEEWASDEWEVSHGPALWRVLRKVGDLKWRIARKQQEEKETDEGWLRNEGDRKVVL